MAREALPPQHTEVTTKLTQQKSPGECYSVMTYHDTKSEAIRCQQALRASLSDLARLVSTCYLTLHMGTHIDAPCITTSGKVLTVPTFACKVLIHTTANRQLLSSMLPRLLCLQLAVHRMKS